MGLETCNFDDKIILKRSEKEVIHRSVEMKWETFLSLKQNVEVNVALTWGSGKTIHVIRITVGLHQQNTLFPIIYIGYLVGLSMMHKFHLEYFDT